ncbi:MAG: Ig-like domain repeat protein [Methanomassiliicoccaceae archaeon]|nr:Ig-like domain repeat protein [Methanomassiliicoccaceae archaeon]
MAILIAAMGVGLTSHTSDAAGTITVTNGADSGSGSLRYALMSANDGDTIVFDSSVTTVTLTSGEIAFSKSNITIDGGGGVIIVNGADNGKPTFRLLNNTVPSGTTTPAGTLTLIGLTFKNGNVSGTGGGVYSGYPVIATNCIFDSNKSTAAGAGLYINYGDSKLTNCTFTSNATGSAGGGLYTNNSITLTGCTFTSNDASGGNGGGVRAWGSVTATDCTFTGNITRQSTNASGGGIWSNNNIALNGCVFNGNVARIHGSAVSAANGSLLVISNSTFVNNKPYTTSSINPTDVGTIDCATRTYIFQSTIVNNIGGGVYAGNGKTAYLYNSILAGNTNAAGTAALQTQTTSTGAVHNISSLVEGTSILGRSVLPVTFMQVFGLNDFSATDGTIRVLGNGIAAGTASSISISNIVGYSGLSSSDRAAIDGALAALGKDQMGADRSTSGSVTYGSVETSANSLLRIEVVPGSAAKEYYTAGDAINLTGTLLDLIFTNVPNDTISGVSYLEPGMTNTSGSVDMSTIGDKYVDFTYLGVTTVTPTNLEIHVSDTTTLILTSSSINNTSVNGESVTFSAQVTTGHPGSGDPSAANFVSFFVDGTFIDHGEWNSLGVSELTLSLPSGNHLITATLNESATFNPPSSDSLTQNVLNADTVITVTGVDLGASNATIWANLSVEPPGSASLSGLEVFFYADDNIALGSAYCTSDGKASLTLSYLEIAGLVDDVYGEHTIYAVFNGSTGLNSNTSGGFSFDAGFESTSITLTTDPTMTSLFGENISITATLLDSNDEGIEGMTINFYDNGSWLGDGVTNSSGEANLPNITNLTTGNHLLSATFDGDDNEELNGSSGWTTLLVRAASTNLTFTVDPTSPQVYDNSITITATLSVVSPGEADLTGKLIIFKDFSTVLRTVPCDASGEASLTIDLPVGNHNLSVSFDRDGYLDMSYDIASYEVNKSDTLTTLNADLVTTTYGDKVTFTAAVTAVPPGTGTPAGTVEFFDDGVSMGTAQLDASGIATFATTTLSRLDHEITANYLGNDNYEPTVSSGVTVSVVAKATPITTLSATPYSTAVGKEATFIATVTSAEGTPTGTVEFYNDGVLMGTGPIDADGKAAYSTSDLDIGTYPITAKYLGNDVFSESDSNTLQYVVALSMADKTYTITATADQGATITPIGVSTVSAGGSITFTFSAASVKVNGQSLSPTDISTGSFTFSNVLANQTIDVSGVGTQKPTYTLTIDVKEGSGHAEYIINGSAFTAYTTTITIQQGSSVSVKAVADSGYSFKEWNDGNTTTTNAQIDFSGVSASIHLDLYFGEKSGGGSVFDNHLLWWGLGLLLLIIIILLLLFIFWRRRKDEEEDVKGSH